MVEYVALVLRFSKSKLSPENTVGELFMNCSVALPKVLVLMATYNGASFIGQQLISIAKQSNVSVDLFISDDGSTDGSLSLLREETQRWIGGAAEISSGPSQGFSENFRSLILRAECDRQYIAFSDQDDIWDENKLIVAVDAIKRVESRYGVQKPVLYCSRTRLVAADGRTVIGCSPICRRPPSFKNAIVQSLAGGNTMVFNCAALRVLTNSAQRTSFVSHDWWAYMMITGVGGTVLYDAQPHVAYRQHNANLMGANAGASARFKRLGRLWNGQFSRWASQNEMALKACSDLLTDEARATLDEFSRIRESRHFSAIQRLYRSGIHRQEAAGTLGLIAAASLGKM